MCIKDNYNTILISNNYNEISDFIDNNCKLDTPEQCYKTCGGCDYLGKLDDKLKELE